MTKDEAIEVERKLFDAWFEREYPDREDRQQKFRMTSVRDLMLAAYIAGKSQPTTAPEEVRDTERLDLMIAEECQIEHLILSSGIRYRLYWPVAEIFQAEWHETPRAAIDCLIAAIATTTPKQGE